MGGSRLRLMAATLAVGFALAATSGSVAGAGDTFLITGSVDGLYPGIDTTMPATVSNPFPRPIVLLEFGVVVIDTGGPCAASLLSVAATSPNVTIAPNASAVVPIRVALDDAAPDVCQGATFSLQFSGLAVDAEQAAAAPLAFSPSNRAEWGRRLSGVVNAFETPSGSEPGKSGPEPGKQGSTSPPAAADLGVCEKDPDAAGCEESYVPPPREIRVLYYQQGLRLWAHEPILGYGIGHFGGIVAYRTNPDWNLDHRFDKGGGFDKYGFRAKTVDSFWLHLLVEAGALGLAGYLAWMYLLAAPLAGAARRRAGSADDTVNPFFYWAPAAVLFGFLIAFLSPSLEDPLFAPLMFSILGVAWALLARRPTVSPAAAQAVATDGAVVRSASDGPTVTNDPTVTNGNQTRSANDDIHIR